MCLNFVLTHFELSQREAECPPFEHNTVAEIKNVLINKQQEGHRKQSAIALTALLSSCPSLILGLKRVCLLVCSAVYFCYALMKDSKITSEKVVNFFQATRCCNTEDKHLYTHRRKNPKSY
jgi:hypothetical protein